MSIKLSDHREAIAKISECVETLKYLDRSDSSKFSFFEKLSPSFWSHSPLTVSGLLDVFSNCDYYIINSNPALYYKQFLGLMLKLESVNHNSQDLSRDLLNQCTNSVEYMQLKKALRKELSLELKENYEYFTKFVQAQI